VKDPLEDVQLTETRQQSFLVLAVILGLLAVLIVTSPWVAAIIIGLIAMVMLHEAGHLLAARRAGMKATEYFLGFGPRLWSFKRGETEYGIKAIPAGGYVRIIGMSNLE
jgi:fatty acid desaturase